MIGTVRRAGLATCLIVVQAFAGSVIAGPVDAVTPTLHATLDPRSPAYGTVEVRGLDAEALGIALDAGALVVRAVEPTADPSSLPGLLGRLEIVPVDGLQGAEVDLAGDDALALRFTPRFPPAPGLVLHARFDGSALGWSQIPDHSQVLQASWRLEAHASRAERTTRVERISPCGSVPANLLRLYVHFSAPMRADDVARHLHLLDEEGREIELPFVEVKDGLWDPERRRLTLFLHPGRVKRGVGLRQSLGPILEAGRRVILRIDEDLRDAAGRRLAAPFEAVLTVEPDDRRRPDPSRWTIEPPSTRTAPLRVLFDEPLDPAQTERALTLLDESASGRTGEGGGAEGGSTLETRIVPILGSSCSAVGVEFHLEGPWRSRHHAVAVAPSLEDLAGNRVDQLFDREILDGSPEDSEASPQATISPVLLPVDIEPRVHF